MSLRPASLPGSPLNYLLDKLLDNLLNAPHFRPTSPSEETS